jgi:hypothetical protein
MRVRLERARNWEHGIVTGKFSLSPVIQAWERAKWRAPAEESDPGSQVRLLRAPRETSAEAMVDGAMKGGLATRARFENDPEFRARAREASSRGGKMTGASMRRRVVEAV